MKYENFCFNDRILLAGIGNNADTLSLSTDNFSLSVMIASSCCRKFLTLTIRLQDVQANILAYGNISIPPNIIDEQLRIIHLSYRYTFGPQWYIISQLRARLCTI